MRKLIIYPNCSKGGVTSVIRGRAVADTNSEFQAVFFNDRGGRDAFSDLPNVTVRLPRKDRVPAYISHLLATTEYASVSVLSAPDLIGKVSWPAHVRPVYEFHSSDMAVIKKEISTLALSKLSLITAPSAFMASRIRAELPTSPHIEVRVVPNLVDTTSFWSGTADRHVLPPGSTPLLWVGRFDKGKGYRYFLRLLGGLPTHFFGVAIVSLESDPRRAADFLAEAYACGVDERIRLLLNVPQRRIGELYREAAEKGGCLVSTSLLESFGYSVAEALTSGLPVAAFDLPPFHEHRDPDNLLRTVEIGDVQSLRNAIEDH